MTCRATSASPWPAAIDIVVPYNFWRTLYFATGGDGRGLHSFTLELNFSNSRTHS
jgi:hypothetical protein